MTTPAVSYGRAPSGELLALLKPEGFLGPLIDLNRRKVGGYEHDVHFRAGDEVHVYRGGTRLLRVKILKRGGVKAEADKKYKDQRCATGLFRTWRTVEHGFEEALNSYLRNVSVGASWTSGEGAIQMLWSRVKGPWVPFDREGRLDYENKSHREKAFNVTKDKIKSARDELRKYEWVKVGELEKSSGKLDQLAVDSDGRLVLLELKDGSKHDSKVYCAPYQLLQYVGEWHGALEEVRTDVQKLIDARVELGLRRLDVTRLTEGIRAAIGFGSDFPSARTEFRYRKVLNIVN